VHRTDSVVDIEQTVADLTPGTPADALIPAPVALPAPANAPQRQTLAAILGGVERHGAWTPPRRLDVSAVMGGVILDFRDASLSTGVTEIRVVALMGGVQVIVPPNLSVEVSGTAIMGGFAHLERTPPRVDPDQPVLRVTGLDLMGGVAVETRLPGESEGDAHRRRRQKPHALAARDEPRRLPERTTR
jgi:hypothetical protein